MATATETNVVEAQVRQAGSKNVARRVRKSGKVPAVVYGAGKQAVSVSVDPKQIARIVQSESGYNTIFDLHLDGERTKAMIVDWQYEPIKGGLPHLDLKRIAMDQRLKVEVASLKTPARIEEIAKGQLGMALPTDQQVVLVK